MLSPAFGCSCHTVRVSGTKGEGSRSGGGGGADERVSCVVTEDFKMRQGLNGGGVRRVAGVGGGGEIEPL